MKITFDVPQVQTVVRSLGIDRSGPAQLFHTQNVLRRMLKYMPMETGMLSTKQTVVSSSTTITTNAPQARYLYYGKRMVNSKTGKGPMYIEGVGWRWPRGATLVPTEQDLNFTKTFHPLAGPYWDRRLAAAEGDIIAKELKDYITRTAGK